MHEGKLVDCDGRPLGQLGDREDGMYAMDLAGHVYTSLGLESSESAARPRLRHSSLVAGGPVAAAGMLTVAHGRLLCLSNESGHYAPPPSCLGLVMERLACLGVARLDEVTLETVRRLEYEPGRARAVTTTPRERTLHPAGRAAPRPRARASPATRR